MMILNIGDASFKCIEKGKGETVVLVHGSASDYRTWQNQLDEFSRRYRVVTYSRRYHWPNEPIAEGVDYAMPQQVDDLRKVIEKTNSASLHLIGHSYGAFLCLLLAMRSPEGLRSLVLAEPPVLTLFTSPQPNPAEILSLFFTRPRTAAAIMKFGVRGVVPATSAIKKDDFDRAIKYFGAATLGRTAFAKLSETRKEMVRANFIKTELTGSGFAPIDQEKVRSLKVPVLLVNSLHSPALFHRLADRLEELLPNVERAFIPDASHIMHEDNPAVYNETVLSFLDRHNKS